MKKHKRLTSAALKRIGEIEDEYLAKKALQILKDIEMGKEKTISWKTIKKRVGWDKI
jgi:predicted DNA-binding protein